MTSSSCRFLRMRLILSRFSSGPSSVDSPLAFWTRTAFHLDDPDVQQEKIDIMRELKLMEKTSEEEQR